MLIKGLDSFSPREFLDLIMAVKWGTEESISLEGLKRAISSTTQVYGIRNNDGALVALARVLSDNYLFSTIPEILVHPDYQKHGYGKLLMEEIKNDFGHTVIFFGAQKGNEGFFEKLGYQPGMQSYTKKFRK